MNFLKYIYYTYYVYVYETFSTTLDKVLRKEKMGKLENKLKKIGPLNMKEKKWNKLGKSKRSSYSLCVFKHGCSLESIWNSGDKNNTWAFVCFKKLQNNSNIHMDFKTD